MSAVELAYREERARVVATLARRLGDLGLAEDAVQEAFAAAATRWPVDGVPDRPGAWLTTTAWRKALDVLRRERATGELPDTGVEDAYGWTVEDDRLHLLLACCHPALALEARVALTLRHVAGLTTREIAAAFLVPEATMTKRLVRARSKIRDARISFELPERAELPERLAGVQAVVYLLLTEGHQASGDGPAVRTDLCEEAVWLARQLHGLVPADAETAGLLALCLLQTARLAARVDGDRLVPFTEQDRSRWDSRAVDEARLLLATAGPPGPYQVQAVIALLHATAAGEPPWPRIADLYGILASLAPSPVVDVNRAVAVGRADGPQAGLAVLQPALDDVRLRAYAPLHAAHADLLGRAGRPAEAAAAWTRAADVSTNPAQAAELRRESHPSG